MPEFEPPEIGRRCGIVRSAAVVPFVAVEINAVVAGVRKNAVKNYFYTKICGGSAKLFEILLAAEQGVYFHIIRRVVAVV